MCFPLSLLASTRSIHSTFQQSQDIDLQVLKLPRPVANLELLLDVSIVSVSIASKKN